MLARRLVESGVRFVTVQFSGSEGWDNHTRIKEAVGNGMPAFDHAFAGLITDLDQRGLLDLTIVVTVTSEFGRTPKINENAGRDHWARRILASDRRRRDYPRVRSTVRPILRPANRSTIRCRSRTSSPLFIPNSESILRFA